MTENEIIQIENEIYTKIVIDELQKQKVLGKKITDYVLDRYDIEKQTKEKLKSILTSR